MKSEQQYAVLNDQGEQMSMASKDLELHYRSKSDFALWREAARARMMDLHINEYEIAALAQMELDRRAAAEQKKLTMRTTWFSVGGGAIAAIVGVVVGHFI